MPRDLVPRTIELTRTQLHELSALGSVTRRSVSFLVREAVDSYLDAYKREHPPIPVALSSIAEIGQPAFQIRPPPEDKK